ncbi:MAG: hypothetical protein JWM10_3076 [Myxococcaceae bacterium]|nr:hypothetical protein [Myxococcaceae bacterium]
MNGEGGRIATKPLELSLLERCSDASGTRSATSPPSPLSMNGEGEKKREFKRFGDTPTPFSIHGEGLGVRSPSAYQTRQTTALAGGTLAEMCRRDRPSGREIRRSAAVVSTTSLPAGLPARCPPRPAGLGAGVGDGARVIPFGWWSKVTTSRVDVEDGCCATAPLPMKRVCRERATGERRARRCDEIADARDHRPRPVEASIRLTALRRPVPCGVFAAPAAGLAMGEGALAGVARRGPIRWSQS